MKNLPPELIYLLVIGGILLFNYVMQQAARRQQKESPEVEPPAQDEPLEEIFTRRRPVPAAETIPVAPSVPARVEPAQFVAAEIPRRRSAARSLLSGRRNLRRAYVVMTVLGPCRAQEPLGALPGDTAVGTSPRRAPQG